MGKHTTLILLLTACAMATTKTNFTPHKDVSYNYIKQKLIRSFWVLKKVHSINICSLEKTSAGGGCNIGIATITHPDLCQCVQRIEQQKNLAPFINCIKKFEQDIYKYDQQFVNGFLVVFLRICLIVKDRLLGRIIEIKNNPIEHFLEHAEDLNPEDIIQILEAIGTITEELANFIEQYEVDNQEMNWTTWLKKYWWAPPLLVVSIYFKVLLQYKIPRVATTPEPSPWWKFTRSRDGLFFLIS